MGKYITIVIIIILFFSNCSGLHLSAWNCVEGDEQCKQRGDVDLLVKKTLDILIVLDNSSEGQELNPLITKNLNQFFNCIEPAVNWRVGIISSVEDDESISTLGQLINLEKDGQVSVQKVIHPQVEDYKQVFSDTVSLSSGCSYPPYCIKGSHKPLSAVTAFMKKESGYKKAFLRTYSSFFATIIVSTSDEKGSTNTQMALNEIYNNYKEDEFIGLAVTDSGIANDCIYTPGDTVSNGLQFVSQSGQLFGLAMGNPFVLIVSSLLSEFAETKSITHTSPIGLIQFAKNTDGYVFDICKPHYGRSLAYSILKKMNIEGRFPEECKQFNKQKKESNIKHAFNMD